MYKKPYVYIRAGAYVRSYLWAIPITLRQEASRVSTMAMGLPHAIPHALPHANALGYHQVATGPTHLGGDQGIASWVDIRG